MNECWVSEKKKHMYIYICRGAWSSSRGTSGWSMTTWSYSHDLSSSILIKTSFLSLWLVLAAQRLQIGWVSARTSTALPLRLGHFFSVPANLSCQVVNKCCHWSRSIPIVMHRAIYVSMHMTIKRNRPHKIHININYCRQSTMTALHIVVANCHHICAPTKLSGHRPTNIGRCLTTLYAWCPGSNATLWGLALAISWWF